MGPRVSLLGLSHVAGCWQRLPSCAALAPAPAPQLPPSRPWHLCSMRPQLVLMLSALLPVEARLSYLGLRHAAYAAPGEAAIQSGHSIS